MYGHGWYQLAFERDLSPPISPLSFGGRPLMAVGSPASGNVRVFDAVCPHRGADLGHGGRLAGDCVVCPFHAHLIGLGAPSRDGFCAREYTSLLRAGGLFQLMGQLTQALLEAGHLAVKPSDVAGGGEIGEVKSTRAD